MLYDRYIKCDGMAQQALKDAENQNLIFHPESSIKDWNRWLGKRMRAIYLSIESAVKTHILTTPFPFGSDREYSGLVYLKTVVVGSQDSSI
jgi:hypothetical protein